MTKNLIIAALVLLLLTAACTNIVTYYGAQKLIEDIEQRIKKHRDDDRRWFREFTEEYGNKTKDYEHRLERFRDILRRHRIKWEEGTGAVLEVAPSVIGAKPE